METTYGTLPSYAPAAEIYRSARRNLAIALLLFFGTLAAIAVATIPALDVGATGFGPWDCVLVMTIATFLASLFAIMLMYVNDEHQPRLLLTLTVTMYSAGFIFGTLMHCVDAPRGGTYPQRTALMETKDQPVFSNGAVGE